MDSLARCSASSQLGPSLMLQLALSGNINSIGISSERDRTRSERPSGKRGALTAGKGVAGAEATLTSAGEHAVASTKTPKIQAEAMTRAAHSIGLRGRGRAPGISRNQWTAGRAISGFVCDRHVPTKQETGFEVRQGRARATATAASATVARGRISTTAKQREPAHGRK